MFLGFLREGQLDGTSSERGKMGNTSFWKSQNVAAQMELYTDLSGCPAEMSFRPSVLWGQLVLLWLIGAGHSNLMKTDLD